MAGRYGFLLRCFSHGGVPDLEFDGLSVVLPRSDSFNGNGFIFNESPWRSTKLHINDGAVLSLGKKVIFFFCGCYDSAGDKNQRDHEFKPSCLHPAPFMSFKIEEKI
jgi:hypothetical protein